MTLPLLMIAGAALATLGAAYIAKSARNREEEKMKPKLPFEPPTKPKHEDHPELVSADR